MVNSIHDVVIGFSGSSCNSYIGAYYSWRKSPPARRWKGPVLIHAGEDYFENSRWGDYSCTSLDPEDGTIWTVQEYAREPAWNCPGGAHGLCESCHLTNTLTMRFMNKAIIFANTLLLSSLLGYGQGVFLLGNPTAPTRLGSADGPLAGPDIWAHMLAGGIPEDLTPVGISVRHDMNGIAGGVIYVAVPGIPCREYAYIQMVAWDGRYWGRFLQNVPLDQLGRTDIVRHWLSGCDLDPVGAPPFTQPAIVPPIPEPSAALLGLLGGSLLFAGHLVRRRGRRT